MRAVRIILHVSALAIIALLAEQASAQTNVRSIYRDAVFNRPTVSPYLNLFNPTNLSTTPYYSYVKPQLDQERANRAAAERFASLQNQLNETTATAQSARRQGIRPTGHTAARMYYSHYFPALQQMRR